MSTISKLPKGYYCNGIHCGVSPDKKKKDLAIFYSSTPCVATALFTKNRLPAAPVIISKKHISKNSNRIQAIIANSGCANAATGNRGLKDAEDMCKHTAKCLGLEPEQVLVASTGVIGTYLPMSKICSGIERITTINRQSPLNAVKAIMTTDTFPKVVSKKFFLSSREVCIWATAKGSGMIHPDLATLLCFLLTDANITKKLLDIAVKNATEKSFNCISIDGDTSTNDTVFVLANGMAGNKKISLKTEFTFKKFSNALEEVFKELSQMIISDGEGVTKSIKIIIQGAKTTTDAKKIASSIATSLLVKTAIFGSDPNWGRIIAAIGRSGVKFSLDKIDIYINSFLVAKNSTAIELNSSEINFLKNSIKNNKTTEITINLHSGKKRFEYYSCDLSYDYVRINSIYRT